MTKIKLVKDAIRKIKDGDVIMMGGFLQGGTPDFLIQALLDSEIKNITIVANDTGIRGTKICELFEAGRVSRVLASYIGLCNESVQMMMNDPSCFELVPQGTLAERIRSAGAGLGGFLTPTGIGTIVEEGKQKLTVDGKDYLLEKPIRGNIGLVHAAVVDEYGNCFMRAASKNFNAIIPPAADYVVVEAEKIVPVGELNPEEVTVPGIFIDAIVKVGK